MHNSKNISLGDIFPDLRFLPVDESLLPKAMARIDSLTKPKGSLGKLEAIAARLYAISGGTEPLTVDPALMLTIAGDHGVAAQNVSPFPQEVTRQMVLNFMKGGAAINAICGSCRMDLKIVDAGCAGGGFKFHPLLLDRRLGNGAGDISEGPAMSLETCVAGLRAGADLALDAAKNGYACLGMGEMGIANTTSASALYCALLHLSPCDVVGPGTGSTPEMIIHKGKVVEKALEINSSALLDANPAGILAALGGFEIVEMAGVMLGCASQSLPFLVDGFICAAAYAAARAICPQISGFAFFSHYSAEPAFAMIMKKIGAHPLLDLGFRLGEGTGSAMALPLLRAAAAVYNNMASMESANISNPENPL